jgi:hypothetical protein
MEDQKMRTSLPWIFALALFLLMPAPAALGQAKKGSGGLTQVNKPMNIQGQSRALNMQMVLRGNQDRNKVVQPRSTFRKEIMKTVY